MKKLLLAILPITAFANPYTPKIDIDIKDQYSIAGVYTTVFSHNCAQVENPTDSMLKIRVQYNLCVVGAKCDMHYWNIKVNPNAIWHDCYNPQVVDAWRYGDYNAHAEVMIDGVNADLHANKFGDSTLHVR